MQDSILGLTRLLYARSQAHLADVQETLKIEKVLQAAWQLGLGDNEVGGAKVEAAQGDNIEARLVDDARNVAIPGATPLLEVSGSVLVQNLVQESKVRASVFEQQELSIRLTSGANFPKSIDRIIEGAKAKGVDDRVVLSFEILYI